MSYAFFSWNHRLIQCHEYYCDFTAEFVKTSSQLDIWKSWVNSSIWNQYSIHYSKFNPETITKFTYWLILESRLNAGLSTGTFLNHSKLALHPPLQVAHSPCSYQDFEAAIAENLVVVICSTLPTLSATCWMLSWKKMHTNTPCWGAGSFVTLKYNCNLVWYGGFMLYFLPSDSSFFQWNRHSANIPHKNSFVNR